MNKFVSFQKNQLQNKFFRKNVSRNYSIRRHRSDSYSDSFFSMYSIVKSSKNKPWLFFF